MNTEQEYRNDLKRDLTHLLNMIDRNTSTLLKDDLTWSITINCVSGEHIQPYIAFLVSKYDLQSTELKNNPYPVTSSDLQMDRRHFPLPLQRL